MEQYCAYENRGSGKKVFPYLINLQHPSANVLKHILVAPVIEQNQLPDTQPPTKICPVITIAGQNLYCDDAYDGGFAAERTGQARR